ncbi:MAG: aspartate/glutamate racemase family protein [Burkholderiaceae bacterium]
MAARQDVTSGSAGRSVARILVINPNTSSSVTDMVLAACRAAQPQLQWEGVTAAFGHPYIASEASYAVAAHAVLDAYAKHYEAHDAVLIACFGDPGLLALRETSAVPVLGLAESSFRAAEARGPFAVVTGGSAWGPMLERFARAHSLDAQLRGIFTVDLTGAQIAADPRSAYVDLGRACQAGVDSGARVILLGGAALTGLGGALQPDVAVPVLDNVLLAAHAVRRAIDPVLEPGCGEGITE